MSPPNGFRRSHNPKVAGSNPAPATNQGPSEKRALGVLFAWSLRLSDDGGVMRGINEALATSHGIRERIISASTLIEIP